ncbi:MAG: hypothetical protein EOM37_12540 [Proteobacteria bacterium]|nr:hypothetical protein [Pseudomonadota bacterium]
MHWEKLLGYEPASRLLVKDTGDPALVHIRIVIDDEEQDKDAILWALRKTFENGHALPPDLGLAVCDLLEAKKPAHKPPTPEAQRLQGLASAELYAQILGGLRVRRIMEGHPRFAERASLDLYKYPSAGAITGVSRSAQLKGLEALHVTKRFKDFCAAHRLAILCGEVREVHKMLLDGIITIEGDYQRWIKVLKSGGFMAATKDCRTYLELEFNKKNSILDRVEK